jgi:mRNA-degrading endonuclease toxin of MazEF toxin-antitoxin module
MQAFRVAIRADQITQVNTDRGHVADLMVAMCDQLRALAVERFGSESRLGRLKNKEFAAVEAAIRNALMLDEDEDED